MEILITFNLHGNSLLFTNRRQSHTIITNLTMVRRTCYTHTHRIMRNAHKILVGKPARLWSERE
jgi:hypothetical protein